MHLLLALHLDAFLRHESMHPFHTLLADCHLHIGELGGHHGGFVAEELRIMAAVIGKEALAFALVAAAEHGGAVAVGEQPQQIFDMRRLAAAPGAEVAHTDGGDVWCRLPLEAYGIKEVPHRHAYGIPHGQWP